MKAVTQKLKSRCGISLAIALVFFLLCAMVGTVVLTAASASAGNTARERQLYRQTQALTSAAQLLSQDIQGMTYTGSYIKTETVTTTVTGSGDNASTTVTTTETYASSNTFELKDSKFFSITEDPSIWIFTERFKDDLDAYCQGKNEEKDKKQPETSETTETTETSGTLVTLETPKSLELVFEDSDENTIIPVVKGTVKAANALYVPNGDIALGDGYGLTVELICGENSMILTFPANFSTSALVAPVDKDGNTKTTVTTYTTTITWGQALMQEGGKADG